MRKFICRILVIMMVWIIITFILQRAFQPSDRPIAEKRSPTRQVLVQDVLAADIPTPTLTRVRFPGWDYYKGENLQADITGFNESPILADLESMPRLWRKHFPARLPCVKDRLPENPAVVAGCDSIGEYGGVWRRCDRSDWNIYRKIGYESFVKFGPSGEIQPSLAWKWTIEDNNRVFTFYLRKGHKWSDGHPFTTKDLLWNFRDQKLWPHGNSRPDWMATTDGRVQLYHFDISDFPALARVILAENEADAPSMGKILVSLSEESFKTLLERIARCDKSNLNKDDCLEFVDIVNITLRKSEFYRPENYDFFTAGVFNLKSEISELTDKGYSRLNADEKIHLNLLREVLDTRKLFLSNQKEVSGSQTGRMNLLALRKYYRKFISPGYLRHVRVEAIADENGDDSHIIRFTFDRPNSIFLEKTATFMFYTRQFDMPYHKTAPLHVLGSSILNTIDIFRWEDFVKVVLAGSNIANKNTPAASLWSLLDKNGKELFISLDGAGRFNFKTKQAMVDAVNKALRNKKFYRPAAWANIDLDAKLNELTKSGWVELCRNRVKMRQTNELELRADLARRLDKDGPDALSDDEIFTLNLMMFRAAFEINAENPVISPHREDSLNKQAREHPNHFDSWSQRYMLLWKYDEKYNNDLPTLKPWRVASSPEDKVMLAVRNPYYYKVDPQGNQLPYLDAVETTKELRPQNLLLKLASGNVDFQVRGLQFESYSYLKAREAQGNYELRLWANDYCGEVTFLPIQPHADEKYADLQEKPQFRHALSLAINRQEIIDVVYNGIGSPAQFSIPAGSPYYNAKLANTSVEFAPERASKLLDEMGLDKRRSDGIRLLPDGRPLIMNVEAEEGRPMAVIQMVCQHWRDIGIDSRMHIRSYAYLSRMMKMGKMDILVHKEGGNYFGPMMPAGFAPTHPAESVQWYSWTDYIHSNGRKGWPPPKRILHLQHLWEKVVEAPNEQAKLDAWSMLCERTAQDLPIIGITTSPGKLVYVRKNFKNVPKIALAGWIAHDPGNCMPETFYMDDSLGEDKGLERYR